MATATKGRNQADHEYEILALAKSFGRRRFTVPVVDVFAAERLVRSGMLRSVRNAYTITKDGRAILADLKRRRPRAKMEGPTKPSTEPDVAKKRGAIKNPDTPLGQTAAFMRHRMERLDLTVQGFADELTKAGWDGSFHAVRKWITGANGPTLGDLMYVAKALGYADWVAFVADVGKFHRKK